MTTRQARAVALLLLSSAACSEPTGSAADAVASVTIHLSSTTLYAGEVDQLTLEARDAAGAPVGGIQPVWASSDTLVASISATGVVLPRSAGTAILSAAVGRAEASVTLTVLRQPAALTIAAQPSVLTVEDTVALGVTVLDSSGAAVAAPRLLIQTTDSAIAYLTPDGRLIARGGGNVTISLRAYPHVQTLHLTVVEFARVSAGDAHTCALTTQAEVYCWGYNLGSQLGDSTNISRVDPAPIARAPGPFASVVAGGEHSCALQPSSATYCWGFGGTGSTDVQPTATLRPDAAFAALSAGRYMTCGLTTAGDAECWGHTFRHGSTLLLATPTPVAAAVPFAHVDVGHDHVCAIDGDSLAYCWGANDSEQLGVAGPPSDSARLVHATDRFADVASGGRHSCGVTSSGELRCWGVWPYSGNPPPRYRTVASPEPLRSVSTQSEYTCALSVTGRAYCMGRAYGLGGLFYPVVSMRPVLGDLRFTAVEAGSAHGCGLTASGVVYCWGRDYITPGDAWLVPTKMRPTT